MITVTEACTWVISWNQDHWEISNLRHAADTTLRAEGKGELNSLLMRVKEESEKAGLKLTLKKKPKIMASSPITSWQIDGKNLEVVTYYLSLDSKITVERLQL